MFKMMGIRLCLSEYAAIPYLMHEHFTMILQKLWKILSGKTDNRQSTVSTDGFFPKK